MKRLAVAAAIAATWAIPAQAADFTGPRIDLITGYDRADGHEGLIYGGTAGADFRVLPDVTVGFEAGYSDSTMKDGGCRGGRELDALVRAGYVAGTNILIYAKAGYTNARYSGNLADCSRRMAGDRELDGVRLGGGVEIAFSETFFGKAEIRYSNLERGRERDQFIAGLGMRF